jgi:pimeloyl-ACP methyl ester carboxylesterase
MACVQDESVDRKVAVIAHGAGSTADFVHRIFDEPFAAVGYAVVSWDRRTPVVDAADEFADLVRRNRATLVGGISVGAILATNLALSNVDLDGLVVALPPPPRNSAATGTPPRIDDVAALIDDVAREAIPWVAAEIRAAWSTYDPAELARELHTASTAPPPSLGDLARCRVATGIVAMADDPVHPVAVAEAWQRAIPRSAMETVQLHAPANGLAVIGHAAVRAWQRAAQPGL